jgi:PAS domain S-box-containing protein
VDGSSLSEQCAIGFDADGWCSLVDNLRAGVFLLEPDSTIIFANQSALSQVGSSPLGLKCWEFFDCSEAKCAACPVHTGLVLSKKADRPFRVLCRRARAFAFRRAGQDERTLMVIEIHGVRSELNSPLHPATWLSQALKEWGEVIDDHSDGTLLMQDLIRRVLNRADAFLWNLIQSSVDAILATDMKGNIFIFNNEATRILGYRTEDVIGRMHITDLYPIETAREIMTLLRSEGSGGKNKLLSYDMEAVNKSGEKIPVRVNASLVMVNGEAFGTVGFFQDQRERIKMEEELSKAQSQLLQAEKMASLGRLGAGIAHQINNPLSGIMLFSNLLLETPEIAQNPEWSDDIQRIADEAERCRSIVKELLEFARQTQQRLQPVELNQALANKIFLLERQVLFQNIDVIQAFSASIPVIHVDPQQLDHVFMNLIINAAQAMHGRGTLTIRTRYLEEDEQVEIQVCDTGHGIPEEIRSRIFEPFFTTKEVGQGTGLGLSMVYGIVERHGGSIRVESEVGAGTTFTVRLPIGGPVGSKL